MIQEEERRRYEEERQRVLERERRERDRVLEGTTYHAYVVYHCEWNTLS